MTGPITVDPTALNSAGALVGAESNAVTSAISTLTAALSGHESGFGHDAAAFVFARSYTNAANALLHSAASAVNASRRTGQGIQMSAYNYGIANAHSTVGGGEPPVSKPGDPGKFSAPGVPSVFGGAIAAPIGWSVVEAFVGGVWPDGDPAQMRATAAAWRTFGSSISGGSGAMTAAGTTLGGFQIPEAPQMQKAANDIGGGLTNIDKQAQALASQIDSFASTVENAQNAIRDLLHQLSPSGILSTIGGMFEGHNPLDKIKQVAHDIDTVLNNMKREANAMDQVVSQGINDLDGLTNKLEAWANKEFVAVFGPEVGGALSMNFTALVDPLEGGFKFVAQTAEGLEQLDPTRFLYDPEGAGKAWLGTAKTLGEAALVGDPFTAPLALATPGIRNDLTNLGKSMFDVEDFKNGHPLRGLAYNAAQAGSLIIPGVGEAAPAADAAGGAARVGVAGAETETRVGGTVARDTGAVASRGGAAAAGAEEVATKAGNITKDLDKVGVPEAAPGPGAAGKAPVEPPPAAPKPEAAPVPKPEPAPSQGPTHEAPAPHTPPAGPAESHTPAPVEHGSVDHSSPSEHHAGAPAESPHVGDGPVENHPSVPEPGHNPSPSTPPPPVAGHDYGFPPDSAFEHVRNPADDIARLHEGGVPPSVTDGYDPLAGRTEEEFKREFTTVDAKGRLQWDWDGQAPNNGFDGPPSVSDHIPAGHQLDRLGSNGGGFMGDEGAPLSTRSMPPGVANDYHTFVGTGRPIPDGLNWRVEYGPAKAAFGQPGGAEQWAVINLDTGRPVSVEELKLWRLIRETTGE
ncbi:TNT domain-containing protein [Mycolicibacterium aubagnense]